MAEKVVAQYREESLCKKSSDSENEIYITGDPTVSMTSSLILTCNVQESVGLENDSDDSGQDSDREVMSETCRKSLYKLRPEFEKTLLFENFKSKLHEDAGGFLNDIEEEAIDKSHTNREKIDFLLKILRGKTGKDFHTFCEALKSSGYQHYATKLKHEAGIKCVPLEDENPSKTNKVLREKKCAYSLAPLEAAIKELQPVQTQVLTKFRVCMTELIPKSHTYHEVRSMCQTMICKKNAEAKFHAIPSDVDELADYIIKEQTTAFDFEVIHEVAKIFKQSTLCDSVQRYEAKLRPYMTDGIAQLVDQCDEMRMDSLEGSHKLVLRFPTNALVQDLLKAKEYLEKCLKIEEAKLLSFDFGCILVYFEITCTADTLKDLAKRLCDHSHDLKAMGISGAFLIDHWAWIADKDIWYNGDNNEDTGSVGLHLSKPVSSNQEDERVTFVPKLTDSLTTICDAQSSAMDLDESTEQEIHSVSDSSCSRRPSPIADDKEILPVPGPVPFYQETGQGAIEGIELEFYQLQGHQPCFRMIRLRSPQGSTAIRHPMCLSGWQRELVRYAIAGQYEKLLKGILSSPPCSQTDATIRLDLGKGHTQTFPLFDVSLKDGESLLQLALEGVLMAENAGENLELLRKKIPRFPCKLYTLYRARLASAACNMSECKLELEKCQAILCKDVYNQGHQRCFRMFLPRFPQGSTAIRPLRHPMVLSGWQQGLVRYAIIGQYEKLLKGILNSPPCSQTDATIHLDLGKGHTQKFPLFDVSLKGGESLLQLALEGVLMAENAGENLELLRKKILNFPYPLYLLYRARLASAHCNTSECDWVWGKCQAILRKDEYNRGKYRSWIMNALGLTARHVENNAEGWERKACYHIDAYNERNVSTHEDGLDLALLLFDQTRTKQSHSLAVAYKGTVEEFPADEKRKFNLQAKGIHDEAMHDAGELLNLLGMQSDPAESPSNLMISLRYDGTLRILRIEQTKLLTINDPIKKFSMIEQQVKHIEGEKRRMGDILGNCYMMVDESLLQKMTMRFNDTLINVRKGEMKFYTLDDIRTSE